MENDNTRYHVFVRNWWTRTPTGRKPGAGRKTTLARHVSYAVARQICKEYNDSHAPGYLSRMAEFQQE